MKNILFFLSIIASTLSFAQTNIADLEQVNGVWFTKKPKEKFTGTFIEYFPSGEKKGTCELTNGLPNGQRIIYYENGNMSSEKTFKKGVYDGRNVEYHENGKIKQEGQMVAGKSDGVWKIYYENGNPQATLTFVNGEEKGDYFQYDESGKLVAQYYILNGTETYSQEFLDAYNAAFKLQQSGKFEEAIAVYDKAIASNPTVARTFYNRGACKSNSMNFSGGIEDYDMALELDPEYKEAYRNRGIAKINVLNMAKESFAAVKLTLEQTQSACEDFNKAAELGDRSVDNEDMIFLYCTKKD